MKCFGWFPLARQQSNAVKVYLCHYGMVLFRYVCTRSVCSSFLQAGFYTSLVSKQPFG